MSSPSYTALAPDQNPCSVTNKGITSCTINYSAVYNNSFQTQCFVSGIGLVGPYSGNASINANFSGNITLINNGDFSGNACGHAIFSASAFVDQAIPPFWTPTSVSASGSNQYYYSGNIQTCSTATANSNTIVSISLGLDNQGLFLTYLVSFYVSLCQNLYSTHLGSSATIRAADGLTSLIGSHVITKNVTTNTCDLDPQYCVSASRTLNTTATIVIS